MEHSSDFINFLQSLYYKVCIAVAISIIRSKPKSLNLNEYVDNIRNAYLRKWQNKNEIAPFENRIISLQQLNILKQTNYVLPTSTLQDDSDFSSEEWLPDINLTKALDDCESSSDNESVAADNAKFMRALIKLKFAVNSRQTLILKRSKTVSECPLKEIESVTKNSFSIETDSGVESFETSCNIYERKSFSTSLSRYVINCSHTDIVIEKCLQTVFNYIKASLAKRTVISFNYWKDSILENIFSILKEVSFDSICSVAIIAFIEDVLEDMWYSEDINKHIDWEFQGIILNELCSTLIICENILTFLINKLDVTRKRITEMKTTLLETSDQCLIEKVPHFIDMTLLLLSKWKRFYKNTNTSCNNNTDGSIIAIKSLWKRKWYTEDDNGETKQEMIRNWKETFEKLVTCTTKDFPFISLMTVELINKLDDVLLSDSDKLNNDSAHC